MAPAFHFRAGARATSLEWKPRATAQALDDDSWFAERDPTRQIVQGSSSCRSRCGSISFFVQAKKVFPPSSPWLALSAPRPVAMSRLLDTVVGQRKRFGIDLRA